MLGVAERRTLQLVRMKAGHPVCQRPGQRRALSGPEVPTGHTLTRLLGRLPQAPTAASGQDLSSPQVCGIASSSPALLNRLIYHLLNEEI